MSVLHSKSLWNCAQLYKAQSLIQMAGMNVAFYNSIELEYSIKNLSLVAVFLWRVCVE